MEIELRCTHGPAAGQTFTVSSELMLGRAATDHGTLAGDTRMSRRHARVFVDPSGRAVIEDLGSTNGTWVNDQRVAGPRALANGDVLRVGETSLNIVIIAPPAAAVTVDAAIPQPAVTVAGTPPAAPRLVVSAGPKAGTEIPLGDELLIGRSFGEPGDLGGDGRLSRRHARIARGPGGVYFIEDTGSSNGTRVNGELVRGARALKDGDEIGIGSSVLGPRGMPRPPQAAQPSAAYVAPPPAAAFAAPPALAVPAAQGTAGAAQWAAQYAPQGASSARLSSHRGKVIGAFAGVFALAAVAAVAVVVLVSPLGTKACPSNFVCQKPSTAPPLHAMTTFRGQLGWRVEYDHRLAQVAHGTQQANQIAFEETNLYDNILGLPAGTGAIGVLIRAARTSQASPRAIESSLASVIDSHLVGTQHAPSSDVLFGVPALGFHPAIGEVLEGNQQTPQGPGGLAKVAVVAAASGGVTIGVAIVYPVQQGSQQSQNPDDAYDQFGDQILETVRFPSDGAS